MAVPAKFPGLTQFVYLFAILNFCLGLLTFLRNVRNFYILDGTVQWPPCLCHAPSLTSLLRTLMMTNCSTLSPTLFPCLSLTCSTMDVVHLPHPQRIGELLQELQSALKPHVSPPPRYTEVASYSYLHSSARRSSTELLHLRRENEQLRQVQRQW